MQNRDNKFSKDYSNKKSIDNTPVSEGEVLVPILAEEIAANYKRDVRLGMQKNGEGICLNNLETWHLGGRKILVGFVAVRMEHAHAAIQLFWEDVNAYIESTRKKRCLIPDGKGGFKRCPKENQCYSCTKDYFANYELSLDAFMEGSEEDGEGAWDPTGSEDENSEEIIALKEALSELLKQLMEIDPMMGKCISLLAQGYDKKEVIKELNLNVKKSQAYAFIEKCQKKAKVIFDKICR